MVKSRVLGLMRGGFVELPVFAVDPTIDAIDEKSILSIAKPSSSTATSASPTVTYVVISAAVIVVAVIAAAVVLRRRKS
jgi:hypothetical protein